jgi:endonuclease/exonuclease/phosphatase (EEP) superfamily protein YafD
MLKVLSYNIREGGNNRLPGIAAIIREQQPDAVALLEATSRANALALAQDLRVQLVFGEASNGIHVAWLSRLPSVMLSSEKKRSGRQITSRSGRSSTG